MEDAPNLHARAKVSNAEYAGPWADSPTVRSYLGRTSTEIARMVDDLELLGAEFSDSNVYFPVRQFSDGTVVDGLRDVLRVLKSGIRSPQVWATWLTGPGPDNSQTIWDALREGRKAEVLIEAEHDAGRWAGTG